MTEVRPVVEVESPDERVVWFDPCPSCGAKISRFAMDTETVLTDPDGVFLPSGLPPREVSVAYWYTMQPCGCRVLHSELRAANWEVHQDLSRLYAKERDRLAREIHKRVNSSRIGATVPYTVGDAERAAAAVVLEGWTPPAGYGVSP